MVWPFLLVEFFWADTSNHQQVFFNDLKIDIRLQSYAM